MVETYTIQATIREFLTTRISLNFWMSGPDIEESNNGQAVKVPHLQRSYAATSSVTCIVCKSGCHPIYICKGFRDASPAKRVMNAVNCLKPGHFLSHCSSNQEMSKAAAHDSAFTRSFLVLECSLNSRDKVQDFTNAILEYFDMGHAKPVPTSNLIKPARDIFYMPMHTVTKTSSTTTKLWVVFDASAKSVGNIERSTAHWTDCADVFSAEVRNKSYVVLLSEYQKDLHSFVYRADPAKPLQDYRMMKLAFSVSA